MEKETVFTFQSTHHAMTAEAALLRAGLAVRVMPRPSVLGEGCGICLRIDPDDYPKADATLRLAQTPRQGAFLKIRDGNRTTYEPIPQPEAPDSPPENQCPERSPGPSPGPA